DRFLQEVRYCQDRQDEHPGHANEGLLVGTDQVCSDQLPNKIPVGMQASPNMANSGKHSLNLGQTSIRERLPTHF
ncbi:MAG TPA: hypothetical protein P5563_08000, partial [Saprospiraceae bacterium]|nr:hypothetical protein [Saprospiraceae bacterium]